MHLKVLCAFTCNLKQSTITCIPERNRVEDREVSVKYLTFNPIPHSSRSPGRQSTVFWGLLVQLPIYSERDHLQDWRIISPNLQLQSDKERKKRTRNSPVLKLHYWWMSSVRNFSGEDSDQHCKLSSLEGGICATELSWFRGNAVGRVSLERASSLWISFLVLLLWVVRRM